MEKHSDPGTGTRKDLIDAFWQLYREKDAGEIRIREITDLAGYHRSTFYLYFTDIFDLLSEEESALVSQVQQSTELFGEDEKDMFKDLIDFYRENAEHVSLLIERGNMDFINQLKENIYPVFLSENHLLDEGRSAVFFEFGFSGMLSALDYWYKHQETVSLTELLTSLNSIFSDGILRPLLKNAGNS